ncbi:SRPBCC domain-containing protein [Fulvivirgaceae bacterium BMA10]|uniref:SRPBCC domain-containing protein n=1 Tax=Splendidivirga corallicola TaxID=3051826 RepID=A0ABT8KPG6_9BACT|nr:SRPBCC domain-containing protein [Fulvivirgaceae bacterium BMA10]
MDIAHNFKIKTSTDKVYEALTTQKGIMGWWSKDCDITQKVGEESHMRFNKDGKIVEMQFRVDTLQPGEKVSWSCVGNPNPTWIGTELRFDMEQQGDEVNFSFTHGNFDDKWAGQPPFEMTKEGWDHFMNSLKNYCEKGEGQPW